MEKIIPVGERSSEIEISRAVCAFLGTCPYGEANFDRLMFNVPSYIQLTLKDREPARARPAEKKWHGVLRNIGAHADQPGNYIHDGILVKRQGGGYQLKAKVKKPVKTPV